jgi:hypothetical protein
LKRSFSQGGFTKGDAITIIGQIFKNSGISETDAVQIRTADLLVSERFTRIGLPGQFFAYLVWNYFSY